MAITGKFPLLSLIYLLGPSVNGSRTMQNPGLSPYPSEEVKILSESILQIGIGLRQEVNETRHQMRSIFQQLKQFNASLMTLSDQINQARKLGEDLDTKTKGFKDNDNLYEAFVGISEELLRIQQESASLDTVIKPLEIKVQEALDTREERDLLVDTSLILSTIEKQNIQIDALQAIVDSHQEHIRDKESKIQRLLKKTSSRIKAKTRRNLGAQKKSEDGPICQTEIKETTLMNG